MFNKDFFPTPTNVLEQMGIDCYNKTVLEPSAGSGNIIDYLKENGCKQVLSCEINEKLSEIVKSKSKFLKNDFFKVTPEEVSHIDLIVMNPPFSNGAKHLLHAWEVAPDGCEIISLMNYQTIDNDYSRERRELLSVIESYGSKVNMGNCFKQSERNTEVEIGLIKLYKPKGNENEFEGFFMDEDPEEHQENGIMKYNAVRDVVQRYVSSVKCFEEHEVVSNKMNDLTSLFGIGSFSISIGHNDNVTTKDDFKKELQKKAWLYLFNLMNLNKYVTSGVMKDINKFINNQQNVPFTMKNIYKMFEIIVGTREQTFNKSLVEAIDKFTMHTYENRYNVEGWKTNSGHLLNKKFIVNNLVETGWSGDGSLQARVSMYGNEDNLHDLIKILCSITATDYSSTSRLNDFFRSYKVFPNKWHEWNFFSIKGFKKGTLHIKFNDEKQWELINRKYAKIKGQVLPEKL